MVTASRRAYLISPGDILQPWCKAGQGIRLICIADRVRFANSAFMIFHPELHCLWRLDKKKTVEKKKKRKKGREKRKEEEEDSRTISTTDFPLPLSDERFLKIVSRFAWIGSCIFMNGNRKRGKAIPVIHRNIPRNIIYRDTFGDNGGWGKFKVFKS